MAGTVHAASASTCVLLAWICVQQRERPSSLAAIWELCVAVSSAAHTQGRCRAQNQLCEGCDLVVTRHSLVRWAREDATPQHRNVGTCLKFFHPIELSMLTGEKNLCVTGPFTHIYTHLRFCPFELSSDSLKEGNCVEKEMFTGSQN